MSDVNSVLKCKIWSYREKLVYLHDNGTCAVWFPDGSVFYKMVKIGNKAF